MFDFMFDFDKDFYNFNRATKDMHPYEVRHFKDKITLVHSVIGISEDDLKIGLNKGSNGGTYLYIQGETHNDVLDSDYKVNSRFEIKRDSIDHIDYYLQYGILYLDLFFKDNDITDIPISKK